MSWSTPLGTWTCDPGPTSCRAPWPSHRYPDVMVVDTVAVPAELTPGGHDEDAGLGAAACHRTAAGTPGRRRPAALGSRRGQDGQRWGSSRCSWPSRSTVGGIRHQGRSAHLQKDCTTTWSPPTWTTSSRCGSVKLHTELPRAAGWSARLALVVAPSGSRRLAPAQGRSRATSVPGPRAHPPCRCDCQRGPVVPAERCHGPSRTRRRRQG